MEISDVKERMTRMSANRTNIYKKRNRVGLMGLIVGVLLCLFALPAEANSVAGAKNKSVPILFFFAGFFAAGWKFRKPRPRHFKCKPATTLRKLRLS